MAAESATQSNHIEVKHTNPFFQRPIIETKTVGNDRVIQLRPIEGKQLDSTGMVDKDLFIGTNKLHGIYDDNLQLWYVKFDSGKIPAPLKQRWTSFQQLFKSVKAYYLARNIEIQEE